MLWLFKSHCQMWKPLVSLFIMVSFLVLFLIFLYFSYFFLLSYLFVPRRVPNSAHACRFVANTTSDSTGAPSHTHTHTRTYGRVLIELTLKSRDCATNYFICFFAHTLRCYSATAARKVDEEGEERRRG